MGPRTMKAPTRYLIEEEGVKALNKFLQIAHNSEAAGVLDYRGAFGNLKNLLQTHVKPV